MISGAGSPSSTTTSSASIATSMADATCRGGRDASSSWRRFWPGRRSGRGTSRSSSAARQPGGSRTGHRWVCPLTAPPSLQEDIELPTAFSDEELTRERFDFTGVDAIGRAGGVFGLLPAGRRWRCVIRQTSESGSESSINRDDSTDRPSAGMRDDNQLRTRPVMARDDRQSPDRAADATSEGRDHRSRSGPWSLLAALAARGEARRGQPRAGSRWFLPVVLALMALFILFYWPRLVPPPSPAPVETRNQLDPGPAVPHADPDRAEMPVETRNQLDPGPDLSGPGPESLTQHREPLSKPGKQPEGKSRGECSKSRSGTHGPRTRCRRSS